MLEKKSAISALESVQRELLLAKLKSEIKPLEKEFEELFFALEIRKGALLSKRKSWNQALSSFQRGVQGLGTFKWPYYWREEATQGLSAICKRDPQELCFQLARRVLDVFPKAANETKELRELGIPEAVPPVDFGGDRLSQAYSEKIEKDEEAFRQLLDSYLKGLDSDLIREVREFLELFPKSALRFRANFLLAEVLSRGGSKKEAESIYQGIIEQIPLSYYSIVSSERLGVDLKARVSDAPLLIDPESQELGALEKASLQRALDLMRLKERAGLGFELENFSKVRNYNSDFLIYLMKIASDGGQDLLAFRFANELIQRKYPKIASKEILEILFPDSFLTDVQVESIRAKLDPLLVLSLIKQESGFKADVISSSGALGLMQLMPFTAVDVQKDLRLASLRDPLINIAVGVRYFQTLIEKYEGNPALALAAYNAGPHRVAKWRKDAAPSWSVLDWIEAIPFKETRDYVTSILRNRYWYQVKNGVTPVKITELKGLTALQNVDKN
ncbi:MAG: lytic transglycosylase domain-containing protein [Bdellovibrionales bacterium]|nr:lytic transglycosylase domain-containing protein [Bdellovibrionales bacterium]